MKRLIISIFLSFVIALGNPTPIKSAKAEPLDPKQYARGIALSKWNKANWLCLKELWHRESRWNYLADNPNSSAFGIPQILNMNPNTKPLKQIDLGITYILHRYDTPCVALNHHNRFGWY